MVAAAARRQGPRRLRGSRPRASRLSPLTARFAGRPHESVSRSNRERSNLLALIINHRMDIEVCAQWDRMSMQEAAAQIGGKFNAGYGADYSSPGNARPLFRLRASTCSSGRGVFERGNAASHGANVATHYHRQLLVSTFSHSPTCCRPMYFAC
jgi:hypothetical protein